MNAFSPDSPTPRVSVVIPNYNGDAWLTGCLEGLSNQKYRDFETILVDNGSTDGSGSRVTESQPHVRVIALERNRGFAAAVNVGIQAARGTYVALLNTDTIARPAWLGALVQTLDESPAEVGAVASRMLSMDHPDMVDDAGDALAWTGAAQKVGHGRPSREYAERREVFSPSAGASLYRRSFLEDTGGFDDRFFAYLEDIDLGLRGRIRGYRFVFEPTAEVLHKGHGSGLAHSSYVRLMTRNRLMLFAKNMPLSLLVRNVGKLLSGQLYFLLAYRRPVSSLIGYGSFIGVIPHVLRERRKLKRRTRIRSAELQALLATEMEETSMREVLARAWRRISG